MLVRPRRIERLSEALQTPAMTTSAKVALVRREGIEPPSDPCKGPALPLDERREIWAGGRELNPISLFHRQQCAPVHYPLH
jgi:hypothetical protein